jgi:hypothetical protein
MLPDGVGNFPPPTYYKNGILFYQMQTIKGGAVKLL